MEPSNPTTTSNEDGQFAPRMTPSEASSTRPDDSAVDHHGQPPFYCAHDRPIDSPALDPATHKSMDEHGTIYPEGGLTSWLVVFGSFAGLVGSLGLLNTIGTFQAYLSTHQLKDYSDGSIGWIFGVYVFLTFFCGVQIGPVFDAKGPRLLVLSGSFLIMVAMIAIGFCSEYWHFMVVFGIINGLGTSLIFTPALSAISHFFYRRRGMATGMAVTGGSIGGIMFPLILENLFSKIGFAWATRVVALICFVLLGTACVLIKSRLPSKPASRENILPDLYIFKDPVFVLTTAGVFFTEWGLFIPISYISSYCLVHNLSPEFSYHLLAILNVGSFFGRWIPGYFADFLGRFNTIILTTSLCLISTTCLWLLAGDSVAILIIYALLFGLGSGSCISLTPVCIGQLCKTENYGRYYATTYTVVSFG
jgi:MFS family permease